MEGVRIFLESSTIHGLSHVSVTRKYARLFWIIIVLCGFLGAGYLIHEQFKSWGQHPIKTTIETLPITEMKLPKVTVCPPKNTYTDLSYDFLVVDNLTLTEAIRDEIFKYAIEVMQDYEFSNWTKVVEDDRFYNWYLGYTYTFGPTYTESGLDILINTTNTHGLVTTEYFGEKFKSNLVERKVNYEVVIYPPEEIRYNPNITLHLKLERVPISVAGEILSINYEVDYEGLTSNNTNFSPPGIYRYIIIKRDIHNDVDLQKLGMDLMPGFKLSWWYTGRDMVNPDSYYSENDRELSDSFLR